jgi:folate-dependent phosphoribosylglycinamide formyltransferase PurN
MRILLITGSHPRHAYVHLRLSECFEIAGIVCMKREALVPTPPPCDPHDQDLFKRHFRERAEVEEQAYGNVNSSRFRELAPTLYTTPEELNTQETASFIESVRADACFIFGPDLIKEPVVGTLPVWRMNLHLGLSPWYRGSATLFWPFYFLQPSFAGATLHQILPEADAGEIVTHVVPVLKRGQGIHEVGAAVVLRSAEVVSEVYQQLKEKGSLDTHPQRSTGRLFLSRDFEPHHLRLIYDTFDDKIVDAWLDGQLGHRQPLLIP